MATWLRIGRGALVVALALCGGLLIGAYSVSGDAVGPTAKAAPAESLGRSDAVRRLDAKTGAVVSLQPVPQRTVSSGKALPSAYDLRTAVGLPAVREQRPYGTCWAFSVNAAMESNAIKKGLVKKDSVNFAELQTVWFANRNAKNNSGKYEDPLNNFGGDRHYLAKDILRDGGDTVYAQYTIASWMGPMAEESRTAYTVANAEAIAANGLPYNYAFAKDACHLRGVRTATMDQPAVVKQLILDYGALDVAYLHRDDFYSSNRSYYQRETTRVNHSVTLVGWNDSYSRTNFKPSNGSLPRSNGAWLVRNNWGSGWGYLGGYFWASYESLNFCNRESAVYAFEMEAVDVYDYCYQYDGSSAPFTQTLGAADKVANVFTAQHDERLKAVSFWLYTPAVGYVVKVYKQSSADEKPEEGSLIATMSGTTLHNGYYTVSLPGSPSLRPGERFSVVLSFPGSQVQMERDGTVNWSDGAYLRAFATARQSYQWTNGVWTDLNPGNGAGVQGTNWRIKAFTTEGVEPSPSPSPSPTASPSPLRMGAVNVSLKGRTVTAKRPAVSGGVSNKYRFTYALYSGTKKLRQTSSTAAAVKLLCPKKGKYFVRVVVSDGKSTVARKSKVVTVKR